MLVIVVCLMFAGIMASTVGVLKAIRSKFTDLDAIIWCVIGAFIANIGALLSSLL